MSNIARGAIGGNRVDGWGVGGGSSGGGAGDDSGIEGCASGGAQSVTAFGGDGGAAGTVVMVGWLVARGERWVGWLGQCGGERGKRRWWCWHL